MALSKRTRFEVFKRDAFTCAYCGRVPPAVTLEVDHIIPRAEGGGDELLNLTTACFDCNRGKAAGLLDNRAPVVDVAEQTRLMREREEQLRAYHEAKAEQVARREDDFAEAWDYWFDVWKTEKLRRNQTPWENPLRNAVEVLGLAAVKEAMDITAGRFYMPSAVATRYFGGIIRRRLAVAEDRVKPCTICGEDIVLERGDDTTLNWHHTACKKKLEEQGDELCPVCGGAMHAGLWYCDRCLFSDTDGSVLAALQAAKV